MGKAGRVACIFTPYALTIASLICIILVGLGCTKQDSSTLNDLYFFRADLQNFTTTVTSEISSTLNQAGISTSNSTLATLLQEAEQKANLKDFYSIGLWGYCDGNINNGDFNTTACSKPQSEYYFNPIQVWGLNGTGVQDVLPTDLQNAINIYKDVSKWMFIAYIVAFVATCAELVVGVFAICSRWGSCVTTLVSSISFFFITAASVTATALFATLTGTFDTALKEYGITGSMGKNMYVTTWLAVAFSLGASVFWMFSSCCCSGRSPYNSNNRNRRVTAEKAPYTYEPIGPQGLGAHPTPYDGHTSYPPAGNHVPMQNIRTSAYEPFRHT